MELVLTFDDDNDGVANRAKVAVASSASVVETRVATLVKALLSVLVLVLLPLVLAVKEMVDRRLQVPSLVLRQVSLSELRLPPLLRLLLPLLISASVEARFVLLTSITFVSFTLD